MQMQQKESAKIIDNKSQKQIPRMRCLKNKIKGSRIERIIQTLKSNGNVCIIFKMQLLIREIQTLNQEVQQENHQLTLLLQKQLQYLQQKSNKKPIPTPLQQIPQNCSMNTQNFARTIAKDLYQHSKHESSFTLTQSRSNKTMRKCDSCKSLSKSRKSSSNSTAITHSKIVKSKHENNMMKLQKLSQKIIPKVSKSWLYKKKTKIFHFQ